MIYRASGGLSGLVIMVLSLTGCGSSGVPQDWDQQADATGKGLAERNFLDACIDANDNLTRGKAQSICECVLAEVQESVLYGEYTRLDSHLKKHGDEVTAEGIADSVPWFTEAVDTCDS